MTTTPKVIAFVPGTTASELYLNVLRMGRRRVWPDILDSKMKSAIRGLYATAMATQTAPAGLGDIVMAYPTDPITPCYQSLDDYMQEYGFALYTAGSGNFPESPDQLFFKIPYDWRQDNTNSAATVRASLQELTSIYGDTEYELYIAGHSNGGLVSRYLLESIQPKNDPWWSRLKAFVTLATPHLGAPLAWSAVTGQQIAKGGNSVEVAFVSRVVNNSSFTSTFELLPPKSEFFISTSDGHQVDIYDPSDELLADMKACGVNINSLKVASDFAAKLDTSRAPVPYSFLYGTKRPTLANSKDAFSFVYTPKGGTPEKIFTPQKNAGGQFFGEGDGVVPEASASCADPSGVQTYSFPEYKHGQMGGSDMTGYPDAIVKMLGIFGFGGSEATSERAAEAAVRV